jgi:hypothetical protein
MLEIFVIQLIAAVLGAISTAWADWSYNAARIGRRFHAFWVSVSVALICLPVVTWTSTVFLGSGLLGQAAAGIVIAAVFFGVHRNLPASRAVRKLSSDVAQHSSASSALRHPGSADKLFSG